MKQHDIFAINVSYLTLSYPIQLSCFIFIYININNYDDNNNKNNRNNSNNNKLLISDDFENDFIRKNSANI